MHRRSFSTIQAAIKLILELFDMMRINENDRVKMELYFLTLVLCQWQRDSMAGSADDNGEHSGEARDEIMIMCLRQNSKKCMAFFFRILTF